jgi:hypothetical protein
MTIIYFAQGHIRVVQRKQQFYTVLAGKHEITLENERVLPHYTLPPPMTSGGFAFYPC